MDFVKLSWSTVVPRIARNDHYPDRRGAGLGWAAIGTFVVGYDLLADETLTNGFARAANHENPALRVAAVAGLGIVAAHLMDVIPDKYDPIDAINRGMQSIHERVGEWTTEGVRIP